MNSFELNKVLGAMLGTCLVLLALNIGAGAIFAPEKPAKPGYEIAVKEGASARSRRKEKEVPIATLLAKASVEKGQAAAKQCQACHTFEKGGPNRVGPNSTASSTASAASHPRLQLFGGDEGQRRQMDLRGAQQIPRRPARIYPRHRHDLRGSHARHAARRRHRLPAHARRTTRSRCPRRRRRTKPNRTRPSRARPAAASRRAKPAEPSRPKPSRGEAKPGAAAPAAPAPAK